MFKITDTMVLAFLKKGMDYEVKNAEMEFNIPLTAFGADEDCKENMKMTCKMEGVIIKISQD